MGYLSRFRGVLFLLMGVGAFGSGCLSSGVKSSGAALPVDAAIFDDGVLKVELDYKCDDGRCRAVKAEFFNVSQDPVTLIPLKASLVRAGQRADLKPLDPEIKKITLQPKESAKVSFGVFGEGTSQKMSYVRPEGVWCSLKIDDQCKNVKKAEAACAGFSRYYYDTYMSTGGWLSFSFPYERGGKGDVLKSPAPQLLKIPPPFVPEETAQAPSFLTTPDNMVMYKVKCDDKCVCKEVTKKRNFFLDDKMRAEFD